jgi:hypothetical protein
MTYSIVIPKPWRYRHPGRGMQVLPPGRYDVPGDIREALALRALAVGMARREATFGAIFDRAPEAKPAFVPEVAKAPKKRGGRRKSVPST